MILLQVEYYAFIFFIVVVDFSTRSFSIVAFPSISSTSIRNNLLTKLLIDVIVLGDFPLILY
jgi:hypothetical protein